MVQPLGPSLLPALPLSTVRHRKCLSLTYPSEVWWEVNLQLSVGSTNSRSRRKEPERAAQQSLGWGRQQKDVKRQENRKVKPEVTSAASQAERLGFSDAVRVSKSWDLQLKANKNPSVSGCPKTEKISA